jgi:hypothetical protein
MQIVKEVDPHLHCAMCQHVRCHLLILIILPLFYTTRWDVGACIRHIVREGQVEWTTTHH